MSTSSRDSAAFASSPSGSRAGTSVVLFAIGHDALRAQVHGDIRFDRGTRALYATDGSNYRQVPIGVVLPRDPDDVVATVALCRQFGAPLLCRGGGTSSPLPSQRIAR